MDYRDLANSFIDALGIANVGIGKVLSVAHPRQTVWIEVRNWQGQPIRLQAIAGNVCLTGHSCGVFRDSKGHYYAFDSNQSYATMRRDTQFRRIHPKIFTKEEFFIPIFWEMVAFYAPSLWEISDFYAPSLIEKTIIKTGDVGILFYKIEKHFGTEEEFPDDLCPCEYKWVKTENGCQQTCAANGQFKTLEDCSNFNPNVTAHIGIYHALMPASATSPVFVGANLSNAYPDYFIHVARAGMMFVTCSMGTVEDIVSHNIPDPNNSIFNDVANTEFSGGIGGSQFAVGWEQVTIWIPTSHAETNYYYSDAWRTNYLGWGLKFGDRSTGGVGSWVVPFPSNADVRYAAPDQIPSGATCFWRMDVRESVFGSFGDWYWRFQAMNLGILGSVQEIPVTLYPPTPEIPRTPKDESGNWFVADLYFGGATTPIFLGSYLASNFIKNTNGLGGRSKFNEWDFPDNCRRDESLTSDDGIVAKMSAIAADTWEIIIKYGRFQKLAPNSASQSWAKDACWCSIDKITVTSNGSVSKITYKYPQIVDVHPDNPFGFWAKRWETDDNFYLDSTEYQTIPSIEKVARAYMSTYLSTTSVWIAAPNTGLIRIQGGRLGQDIFDPKKGLARIGCNFLVDTNSSNKDVWAIDACLNQWIDSSNDIFIEAIKTNDANVKIKVGKVATLGIYSNWSGIQFTSTPKALVDKKVLSLGSYYAGILEACCWVDVEILKTASGEIPYPLYETGIEVGATGNWEDGITPGIITFPLRFANKSLYYSDESATVTHPLYPSDVIGPTSNRRNKYETENISWTFKDCNNQTVLLVPGNLRGVLGVLPAEMSQPNQGFIDPYFTHNQYRWKIVGGC